jgi:tRNA-binding protein
MKASLLFIYKRSVIMSLKKPIQWEDFEKVDIRVGKIVEASLLDDGKYSTHKLLIDFGEEIGQKKSCARLIHYECDELIDRQVLAVANFPPRQIGKSMSEVLVIGVPREDGEVSLAQLDSEVPLGGALY